MHAPHKLATGLFILYPGILYHIYSCRYHIPSSHIPQHPVLVVLNTPKPKLTTIGIICEVIRLPPTLLESWHSLEDARLAPGGNKLTFRWALWPRANVGAVSHTASIEMHHNLPMHASMGMHACRVSTLSSPFRACNPGRVLADTAYAASLIKPKRGARKRTIHACGHRGDRPDEAGRRGATHVRVEMCEG
jgi:hypothetical protein